MDIRKLWIKIITTYSIAVWDFLVYKNMSCLVNCTRFLLNCCSKVKSFLTYIELTLNEII